MGIASMTSHAYAVAQRGNDAVPDRIARAGQSPGSVAPSAPDGAATSQDWRAERIREWLLLLLRFAITRNPKDESAAFAMADELDALGLHWRPLAPSFFRRTNNEVCAAITALADPHRTIILKKHSTRIDDLRLRRAFEAAIRLDEKAWTTAPGRKSRNSWVGRNR
jgi:hypothetical protein